MHLMHRPLEFAQSVGDCVGNIDPPTTYRQTGIRLQIRRWVWHLRWLFFNSMWNADGLPFVGKVVGNGGISSNYFSTLCEMLTDLNPSVWMSVIVLKTTFNSSTSTSTRLSSKTWKFEFSYNSIEGATLIRSRKG